MFTNAPISSEESTKNSLYTGITTMKVLGFNPSKEEIAKIYGLDEAKEPAYVRDGQSTRIDMYLKKETPSILTKLSVFVSNTPRQAQSGNKEFINKKGQSCWAPSLEAIVANEKLAWFDSSTARQAREGEVMLYNILINLLNIDTNNDQTSIEFESWDRIVRGDCSEINGYIKTFNLKYADWFKGEINVLLGVKDGKYQQVYPNAVARPKSTNFSYILKQAESTLGGGFKAYYGNGSFKEFTDEMPAPETNNDVSDIFASAPKELDNPFAESESTQPETGSIFG